MSIHLAIDYSLNSPGFCVFETTESGIRPVQFYFIAQKRVQIGSFGDGMFIGLKELTKPNDPVARYMANAGLALTIATRHKCESIFIEGYSYGSVSSSFTVLVENTATLKVFARQHHLDVTPFAPSAIKKTGCGIGNARKEVLYELGWLRTVGIDLEIMLQSRRDKNPISDLVDAYFVAVHADKHMKPCI